MIFLTFISIQVLNSKFSLQSNDVEEPRGTCHVCIRACACHVFGFEISLESHIFGSKICKHELLIFWGKNFQQLPFSLGSVM